MYNVQYEIGGVGSGIGVYKNLILGWIYYTPEGEMLFSELEPEERHAVFARCPQMIHEELILLMKELELRDARKASLDARAAANAAEAKALEAERVYQELKRKDELFRRCNPSNDQLRKMAREWKERSDHEPYREFLQAVIEAEDPQLFLKGTYANRDNPWCGWVADLYPAVQSQWQKH